jgi:hypothetical protein
MFSGWTRRGLTLYALVAGASCPARISGLACISGLARGTLLSRLPLVPRLPRLPGLSCLANLALWSGWSRDGRSSWCCIRVASDNE